MSVELFKTILAEFRSEDLQTGIPRETQVILNANQIVSVVLQFCYLIDIFTLQHGILLIFNI